MDIEICFRLIVDERKRFFTHWHSVEALCILSGRPGKLYYPLGDWFVDLVPSLFLYVPVVMVLAYC